MDFANITNLSIGGKAVSTAFLNGKLVWEQVKKITWIDGKSLNRYGNQITVSDFSVALDYIPFVGGHRLRWGWGKDWQATTTANANDRSVVEYNETKNVVDYWGSWITGTTSDGVKYRDVPTSNNTRFIRFPVETIYKNDAFIQDLTTGQMLVVNGKILV